MEQGAGPAALLRGGCDIMKRLISWLGTVQLANRGQLQSVGDERLPGREFSPNCRRVLAALAVCSLLNAAPAHAEREERPATPPQGIAAPSPVETALPERKPGSTPASATADDGIGNKTADLKSQTKDFETYLDRLMMAESGGRLNAKNPRSTALGPFQFITSTWLSVTRNHLAEDIEGLNVQQILALRTDRDLARKAAAAYTRENAVHLAGDGIATTYGNLRLAFLLGPGGAARVLQAKPDTPLVSLLGPKVIRANPFMARLTAEDLAQRSAREISIDPAKRLAVNGAKVKPKGPQIRVRCNLSRPSCRRWLAMKKSQLRAGKKAIAAKTRRAQR